MKQNVFRLICLLSISYITLYVKFTSCAKTVRVLDNRISITSRLLPPGSSPACISALDMQFIILNRAII